MILILSDVSLPTNRLSRMVFVRNYEEDVGMSIDYFDPFNFRGALLVVPRTTGENGFCDTESDRIHYSLCAF